MRCIKKSGEAEAVLLQDLMQLELMGPKLASEVCSSDLDDARNSTGGLYSCPHGLLNSLTADSVYNDLVPGFDLLGKSACTFLSQRWTKCCIRGCLKELVLGPHLRAAGYNSAREWGDGALLFPYLVHCHLSGREGRSLVVGKDVEVAPGYSINRTDGLL